MFYNINYYIAKLIKKLHIPTMKNATIYKISKIESSSHAVNTQIRIFCSIVSNVIISATWYFLHWIFTSPSFAKDKNFSEYLLSIHKTLEFIELYKNKGQ